MAKSVTSVKAGPTVAVIGGGIAGITAAIKLYQQGYAVTLFEKAANIGGNLSSNSPDSERRGQRRLHDVYPHIFGDWYNEFWYLLEHDLHFERKKLFERRDDIRIAVIPKENKADEFEDINFATISTPTSIDNLVNNCSGEVLSARDMFLFGYTYLDLISVPSATTPSKVLNDLDVTGYLYSRPYMNDQIAHFHDDILRVIWSMPSDQTSAKAYQKIIRHTLTFPNETPFAWLMNGPLEKKLIDPIRGQLEKALDGLSLQTTVLRIETDITGLEEGRPADKYVDVTYQVNGARRQTKRFDYVVIATQAREAGMLALTYRRGHDEKCLVRRKRTLARLREAKTGRIPVVYLYFSKEFRDKHKDDFKHLPKELIGFKKRFEDQQDGGVPRRETDYDISILNLGALWESDYVEKDLEAKDGEPVLLLAASHAYSIEAMGSEDRPGMSGNAQALRMLRKLHKYFPFFMPPRYWNDPEASIDWSRTRVITNKDFQLFLNDACSDQWRPGAVIEPEVRDHRTDHSMPDPGCANVFFAGDYCRTDVDMATVEAAVQSGVLAAQALQAKAKHGNPILLQPHDIYSTDALLLAKLASMPAAFTAAFAATHEEVADDPISALLFPYSVAALAAAFWTDCLRSSVQFARRQLPGSTRSPSLAPAQLGHEGEHDHRMGAVELGVNVALALVTEGPAVRRALKEAAADAAYSAWYWAGGRTLFPNVRRTLRKPSTKPVKRLREDTRSPERVGAKPETWSDLLKKVMDVDRVTPNAVKGAAFGAAATAVDLVHRLRQPAPTPPAPVPSIGDDIREAFRHGAEAARRKAQGVRIYPVKYHLPMPDPPTPPSPRKLASTALPAPRSGGPGSS